MSSARLNFCRGRRVRVVIARVERASKGPGVVVSRAAPDLVQHLFQTEVPEIYDGTVVIRAIAREAGERTKIAVMSKDKDVDAVGACVGMKGMRVQSIIRELRGEKIDIIEFHEDAVTFAEKPSQAARPGTAGKHRSRGRWSAASPAIGSGTERRVAGRSCWAEDRHQE
jgi:N utilization substance protein A